MNNQKLLRSVTMRTGPHAWAGLKSYRGAFTTPALREIVEKAESSDPRRSQKALEDIRLVYEIEESVRDKESADILRARRERSLSVWR